MLTESRVQCCKLSLVMYVLTSLDDDYSNDDEDDDKKSTATNPHSNNFRISQNL